MSEPCTCAGHRWFNGIRKGQHHQEWCKARVTERFAKVKLRGEVGPSFVVPADHLDNCLDGGDPNQYDISFVDMERTEFEALGEFHGF